MTRRDKRRQFSQWLSALLSGPSLPTQRRAILVEPLENRQLLAGDGLNSLLGSSYALPGMESLNSHGGLVGEDELVGEGESAPDLVAFAKALTDSGTRFFGAAWCPHCTAQKQLFEDGYKYLPFIEVTNPDRTPNQIGITENITEYPTWEFPDGSRLTGEQTLATLAQRSGVAIPTSSTPFLDTLPNVNVAIGSPLHIPIDAYDPNGNPLTITVTSSNSSILAAQIVNTNRSLRLSTGFGDMVFELFEDKAPRPAGRVIQLAEDGFYDGITFHRVINNFVIQGGDPTGTGSGGSTLGDFDDQFNLDLQHNQTGVLSYAKSTDDTNDSQFFITEGATRNLDFNHSVFGQLVEGEAVREAISNTSTDSSDKPTNNVVITSATVFNDTENGLVMLKPTGTGTGTSTITVTITDTEGNSTSRSFVATVVSDTANGAPFLNDIAAVQTAVNTPVIINLSSQDAEGDTPIYSVQAVSPSNLNVTVNSSTGVVTLVPPTDFAGQVQFRATVTQGVSTATGSPDDNQLVTVQVVQSVPTSVDLLAASDTGTSSTDNVTNAQSLTFSVAGTNPGALVEIRAGGSVVGSATATGSTTEVVANVSALAQGTVSFTATQTTSGQTSIASPALSVVLDRQGPVALGSGVLPSNTIVSQLLSVNIDHAEEGQGVIYELTSAPSGMTIGASNGQLTWTPSNGQLGAQTISLTLTDAAGNTTNQQISITVIEQPNVRILLNPVDSNGQPITTVGIGDTFKVQITVEDLRTNNAGTGVFAAYVDLLYDSNIVEPIAVNPIAHTDVYTNDASGSTATLGLIDELGAFSSNTARLGNDLRVLAEVTFMAKATGNAALRLEPADNVGHDVLLYDEATEIPDTRISYGTSGFAVGADFELNDDTANFDEDTGSHTINVLNNDVVSGSTVLTITQVGAASGGGQVVIASDGKSVSYTAAANFNGAETFTYTAANQQGVALTATVTVQVTDVNDPPVALNDSFTAVQNSTNNVLEVLGNDTTGVDDSNSETLQVTAVSSGSAGGTITVGSSGLTILYTPATDFRGTETFTYTLSDSRGGTATGSVTVGVDSLNPPPTPQNDNFTLLEDAAQASYDVLLNDTTNDSTETLSISAVGTSLKGSQVSVASDGRSILYRPAANFSGQEILSYTLRDSGGATANGLVTFTVTAVNDAPDAVDDTITALSANTTTTINVLSNDTNVDENEVLTITAVSQPPTGNGTIAIASDAKSLTYTAPSTSFVGSFSFTYTIGDGTGLNDTATVTVDVQDYVPRQVRGSVVYADSGAGPTFSGLVLTLAGMDVTGQAVNESTTVGSNGTYAFANLAPGDYTLSRAAIPFLQDSGSSMQIASGINDGDAVTELVVSGSLKPQFFDIRDFLGSTTGNSLTVVLNGNGSLNWSSARGEFQSLTNLSTSLNSASDTLIVSGTDASQANVQATLPISSSTSRVYQAGQESSFRLLRLRGTPTTVGFQPVAATSGAGEGEANSLAAPNALIGEGESVPAMISSDAIAQPTSGQLFGRASVLSPQQALRQVLGSSSSRTSSSMATLMSESAVDEAMASVLPALERQLSTDLQDTLTADSETHLDLNDSIIASL